MSPEYATKQQLNDAMDAVGIGDLDHSGPGPGIDVVGAWAIIWEREGEEDCREVTTHTSEDTALVRARNDYGDRGWYPMAIVEVPTATCRKLRTTQTVSVTPMTVAWTPDFH